MRQVEAAVLPELLEHVVEERDAGRRRRVAGAVDGELELDRRLLGGALLRGRPRGHTATPWSAVAERGEERVVLVGRADGDTKTALEPGPAREVADEHALVDELLPPLVAVAGGAEEEEVGARRVDGDALEPRQLGGDTLALADQALHAVVHLVAELERQAARDLRGRREVVRQHDLLELLDHPRRGHAKPSRSAAIDHTFE